MIETVTALIKLQTTALYKLEPDGYETTVSHI